MLGLFFSLAYTRNPIDDVTDDCAVCVGLVHRVKRFIESGSENIPTQIKKYCTTLPSQFATPCKKVVEDKLDAILQYAESLSPFDVCLKIAVCSQAENPNNLKFEPQEAPKLTTETTPNWAVTWEENI